MGRVSTRHTVSLAVAALASVLGVASCRDVVSGGEVDAIAALCEKLEDCYGTADYKCRVLKNEVESGSEVDVAAFLERVSQNECDASCSDARSCLDTKPLCTDAGQSCKRDDDCCGFASAEASCEGGACCHPDGFLCDENTICCSPAGCVDGRCGGVACQDLDAPCRSSFDCCSKYCVDADGDGDERCAVRLCRNVGETCSLDEDCCQDVLVSGVIQQLGCNEGLCSPRPDPVCGPEGIACTQDADCCSGVCFPNEDPTSDVSFAGSCAGDAGCAPIGVDCAADGDCCQHGGGAEGPPPLSCDFSGASPRCIVNPTCAEGSCCAIEGSPCELDTDCCSGACEAGFCLAGEATCASRACHSPCTTGAPMNEDTNCEPAGCIAEVVAVDPYCGCVEWDFTCVVGFLDACGEATGCN